MYQYTDLHIYIYLYMYVYIYICVYTRIHIRGVYIQRDEIDNVGKIYVHTIATMFLGFWYTGPCRIFVIGST